MFTWIVSLHFQQTFLNHSSILLILIEGSLASLYEQLSDLNRDSEHRGGGGVLYTILTGVCHVTGSASPLSLYPLSPQLSGATLLQCVCGGGGGNVEVACPPW